MLHGVSDGFSFQSARPIVESTNHTDIEATATMNINVTYDFICPWCWIGGKKLEQALQEAGQGQTRQISFVPYQLNPAMPADGMDRKAYRSAKFGSWARSQAMDAQVTQAGRAAGVTFDYAQVGRTPNTLAAHRLVWFQQRSGGDTAALVDAVFKAYFGDGRDIGDLQILADIAEGSGLDRAATLKFLESGEGVDEIVRAEADARADGVVSVPTVDIGQQRVTGAQPVDVFAQAIHRAAAGEIY
jgi:predicted DsbA family dithiol-disulfide isomerase